MGNKRLTPHPSPLPQVEGAVHCSQFTKPLSAPMPYCLSALLKWIAALISFARNDVTIQPFNYSTLQRVKAKAFTLAETLIVIGIIGVVAALTLPNLNHATGDKETITRVKKIYSSLMDAYGRAEAIYGPIGDWCKSGIYESDECVEIFMNRFIEFMKVSKVEGDFANDGYAVLSDGTTLRYGTWWYGEDSAYVQNGKLYYMIGVDIDGQNKGKNNNGQDLFYFDITSQGVVPDGVVRLDYDDDLNLERLQNFCFNMKYGTQWILQNDNMDYLKVDSEGNCPDGKTQLSLDVTSCN